MVSRTRTKADTLFAMISLATTPILIFLPAAMRIPYYRRTTVDGVTTIADAVQACNHSGLKGWDLVTYAQNMVSRKFATYSCRNLWDPPGRAFAYGMGYCTQYNLALKRILDQLGFQTKAVYALKTKFEDNPAWNMGHTWVQVTIDGEVREVCASRETNMPGEINFTPLSPVHQGHELILLLTHLGLILYAGLLEWGALLTGREVPDWMFVPPE